MEKHKHPRPPATAGRAPLDLSVCFIARDEENNLPRALRSVHRVARDIVVVDTGSSDRTPQIAAEAGARVLHEPWQDHFAKARNVAVAAATSSWILMLDADEELDPASLPVLARALRGARPGTLAQIVEVRHTLAGEGGAVVSGAPLHSLLLFRRHPGICYRGRVHETIVDSLLRLGVHDWPFSGVRVIHHGYQDAYERQRKTDRNLRLLDMAVAEEPQDLYLKLKLAQTLQTSELRVAVLAEAMEQVRRLPPESLASYPYLPRLFAAAGGDLLARGALGKACALADRLGEHLGPAGAFTAGRIYYHGGALPQAEAALGRYLDSAFRQRGASLVLPDPEASAAAALHLLGNIALKRGQADQAEILLGRAIAAGAEAGADKTSFQWGHPAAIEADLVRCDLQRQRHKAMAAGLDRVETRLKVAGVDPRFKREGMLLAAEFSLHSGQRRGALPLLQSAIDPSGADDRAAALCALIQLHDESTDPEALRRLAQVLPGTRHDTLAVRLLLALVLDPALAPDDADTPAAVFGELRRLLQGLPPALRARSDARMAEAAAG